MIKNFKYLILPLIATYSSLALEKDYDLSNDIIFTNNLNSCQPTPAALNNYEPNFFFKNNNLTRLPGGATIPDQSKIILAGQLVDGACVPISDAKIQIWQTNSQGTYSFMPLKTNFIDANIDMDENNSFIGNGTSTTDNLGNFNFITIFPGVINNEKPHINIKISHRNYGELQTKIYLNKTAKQPKLDLPPCLDKEICYVFYDKNKQPLAEPVKIAKAELNKSSKNKVKSKSKNCPKAKLLDYDSKLPFITEQNGVYEFKINMPSFNEFRKY